MYTKSTPDGILGVHTLAELPSDAILLRCMYTKSAPDGILGVHTLAELPSDAILLRCMYTKSASGSVPGVHTPRGNRTISYTRTPEWPIGARTAYFTARGHRNGQIRARMFPLSPDLGEVNRYHVTNVPNDGTLGAFRAKIAPNIPYFRTEGALAYRYTHFARHGIRC